jgi:hypothetical protein
MRGDAQARTHDDSSQMIVDKGVVSPLLVKNLEQELLYRM